MHVAHINKECKMACSKTISTMKDPHFYYNTKHKSFQLHISQQHSLPDVTLWTTSPTPCVTLDATPDTPDTTPVI